MPFIQHGIRKGKINQSVLINQFHSKGLDIFHIKSQIFGIGQTGSGVFGAKQEIYELMNEWTSQGIAIILITSEMPELLAMSDRIIVMHRGSITAEFESGQATQEKILHAAMGLQTN